MRRSDIKILPEHFDYYINLNEDIELKDAFEQTLQPLEKLNLQPYQEIGLRTYAEDKWTIHQILQHIIDWERIWCYRTLLGVRRMDSIPDGLDQELMVAHGNANEIPLKKLIDELVTVRKATMSLFASFDQAMLVQDCKFYKYQMSALAIGFSITGHQLHHLNVINERYMPLLHTNR